MLGLEPNILNRNRFKNSRPNLFKELVRSKCLRPEEFGPEMTRPEPDRSVHAYLNLSKPLNGEELKW